MSNSHYYFIGVLFGSTFFPIIALVADKNSTASITEWKIDLKKTTCSSKKLLCKF